jgi:hypothetical protein
MVSPRPLLIGRQDRDAVPEERLVGTGPDLHDHPHPLATKGCRQLRSYPVEAADQVDVRRMDGRGLQRDDHLIATGNEGRLGNKRHDLGRLAEAGQLESGHRMISSDGPWGEQVMMTATARRRTSAATVAPVKCSASHRTTSRSRGTLLPGQGKRLGTSYRPTARC